MVDQTLATLSVHLSDWSNSYLPEQLGRSHRKRSATLEPCTMHELRGCLGNIVTASQLMLMNEQLTVETQAGVQIIQQSGMHLLEIVDNALTLAKLQSAENVLNLEQVDISALIKEAISFVVATAKHKGLDLQMKVLPPFPCIRADKLRIRQVVLNLLFNAMKFTPSGGHIEVTASQEGEYALIAVCDTGVGISTKDQRRIFKPYKQGAESGGGTGLGLYICKQLVEMHGGYIQVKSKIREGSTFFVSLPIHGK